MDKSAVKVNIYGSEYMIKGDTSPEHIQAIARFLDEKMEEINRGGAIKSALKVAILAALNITDEFFRTRDDLKNQIEHYELKTQKLIELLNSADHPAIAETTSVNGENDKEIPLFTQS